MRISADDPKLTAYALDEMHERERLEFERQLTISPDLRAIVSEIRQTAAQLHHEFASENEMFSQDAFPIARKMVVFPTQRLWPAMATAVAAGAAVVLTWQFWFQGSRKPESPFLTATVMEASSEFRPDSDDLKRSAFNDVANIAYGSAAIGGHWWMADSGSGLRLDRRPFHSWPNKNDHFNFRVGYQLEF